MKGMDGKLMCMRPDEVELMGDEYGTGTQLQRAGNAQVYRHSSMWGLPPKTPP
jgi:hypothetical protein